MSICFVKSHPRWVGLNTFYLAFCSVFLLLIGAASEGVAQSSLPSMNTPVPVATNKLGQFDSAALSEVLEHLKAVGAAPWTGMHGAGVITYGGNQTSYVASITIEGSGRFRIDAQTATGPLSIRIDGRTGSIQEPDGRIVHLADKTAASGVFQFPLLRLSDLQDNSSVLDQGVVNVDGMSLHRVVIERPFIPATSKQSGKTIATDFYFDRQTHLLSKSVNSITLDGVRSGSLLRVVAYDDYRSVDGILIPFRYTQFLDGQKQWTLQMSEVQLGANSSSTQFHF